MDPAMIQLIAQVGLPAALVVFFVLWMREEKKGLILRIETVSDQMTELQSGVIKDATTAMHRVSDSSERQTKILEGLAGDVHRLDCMRGMRGQGD